MQSTRRIVPLAVSRSVSSTSVGPRYRRRVATTASRGVTSQKPLSPVPSSAAKQAGASNRGRQSQSIDPLVPTSATVWVSPISA
jgi:hypothetical protein